MICIVGDIVYGTHPENDRSLLDTQENVQPFLKACAGLAPSFLSLGNHEWMLDEEDLQRIRDCGITVLDNDFKVIKLKGKQIVIGGLTSAYCLAYRRFVAGMTADERAGRRYPKKECGGGEKISPDTEWLIEFVAEIGYHILLSNHPECAIFFSFVLNMSFAAFIRKLSSSRCFHP